MNDDMDEDDMDIAVAMGFSSFGGNKKRKHDRTNSPKAKPDASGANSTQLGVRTKRTTTDNTSLEAQVEDVSMHKLSEIRPKATSQPTGGTAIADFLARGHSLPENPSVSDQLIVAKPQGLNVDSSNAEQNISFGGPVVSRAELNALRFGIKNKAGDIAYFKSSFLEDPWKNL